MRGFHRRQQHSSLPPAQGLEEGTGQKGVSSMCYLGTLRLKETKLVFQSHTAIPMPQFPCLSPFQVCLILAPWPNCPQNLEGLKWSMQCPAGASLNEAEISSIHRRTAPHKHSFLHRYTHTDSHSFIRSQACHAPRLITNTYTNTYAGYTTKRHFHLW